MVVPIVQGGIASVHQTPRAKTFDVTRSNGYLRLDVS